MVKILIFVEGQTEEKFVNELLSIYLDPLRFTPIPIVTTTKYQNSGPDCKGGTVKYKEVIRQLRHLLNDSSAAAVTTMIDYYALPNDYPVEAAQNISNCYSAVNAIESAFYSDINHRKFIPYLQLHEFEALLFSDPEKFSCIIPDDPSAIDKLSKIRRNYSTPEHINKKNPPKHRIKEKIPDYQEDIDGPIIAKEIGLEKIRLECPHFNKWIEKLESLQ